MTGLYILGIVKRHGPIHGYDIKQIIDEHVSDFVHIKLPNIYYHLKKYETKGFVHIHKSESRPEKIRYVLTHKGNEEYDKLLWDTMKVHYEEPFGLDPLFYFRDDLEDFALVKKIEMKIMRLNLALIDTRSRHKEAIQNGNENEVANLTIRYKHKELHLEAELKWAIETLKHLKNDKQ